MLNFRLSGYVCTISLIVVFRGAVAQDSSNVWVETVEGPQYFAVLVRDVDEAETWYRTVFGLQEIDRLQADDGSWQIVNLTNEDLFVEIIQDRRSQKVERARGFFKVGFQVPDVERVADRAERATGERPRIIDDTPHGIRILQLKDPDGNTVQFHSPLNP